MERGLGERGEGGGRMGRGAVRGAESERKAAWAGAMAALHPVAGHAAA